MIRAPFPQYFLIQTTSLCNARCLICPYSETTGEQEQGLMKDDLFKKLVDEIAENKHSVKQVMPYFMNEPLMDRTIIEKIYSIRNKCSNLPIHLVTNGILLNEALGDKLIESPLNTLKISVLGHWKHTYENVLGVSGYERIFARITRFVRKAVASRGKGWVSISCTRTPDYLLNEEVTESKDFWNSLGVKFEFFNQPISRAGNVGVNAPHHNRIQGCNSVWRDKMIHVLFNGDVVLCCMDWRREVIIGNVYRQTIHDIWNGEINRYYQDIINGEKSGPPGFLCYRCEAAQVGNFRRIEKAWKTIFHLFSTERKEKHTAT